MQPLKRGHFGDDFRRIAKNLKKKLKSFGDLKIMPTFAIPLRKYNPRRKQNNIADVAQLARARDL